MIKKEEQSIKFEINQNIKSSEVIGTNFKKKERTLKILCRRGNNGNHKEDHGGICLNRIQSLPLSSLSGSYPVNVICCPNLALGSLFEATSDS